MSIRHPGDVSRRGDWLCIGPDLYRIPELVAVRRHQSYGDKVIVKSRHADAVEYQCEGSEGARALLSAAQRALFSNGEGPYR